MSIAIFIPLPLRQYCEGASQLTLSATTVREALDQLAEQHRELHGCICDETGAIRRHVNVFVNNSFLHDREGLDTPLTSGDVLTIMPAVSGG